MKIKKLQYLGRLMRNEQRFYILQSILQGKVPVSYTHLDVYKRQLLEYFSAPQGDTTVVAAVDLFLRALQLVREARIFHDSKHTLMFSCAYNHKNNYINNIKKVKNFVPTTTNTSRSMY